MRVSAGLAARLRGAPRALEAAALLAATRLGLRASPRRAAATLLRYAGAPSSAGLDSPRARAVAQTVERVAGWSGNSTCLSQAVTGWLMLRRRGIPSTVRVGARRGEDGVHMHAWLELGGASIIGAAEAPKFVPLTR